jgi:hypothetical protein
MTEQEWLACEEPWRMLERSTEGVRHQTRKMRLLGCACCRRIWSLIPHDLNRQAVLCVEEYPEDVDRDRFPQGVFSHPELNRALVGSSSVEQECAGEPAYWAVKYLGRSYYKVTPASAGVGIVTRAQQARGEAKSEEAAAQVDLVRDVFGNPFRPVSLCPDWVTPTVTSLAQAACGRGPNVSSVALTVCGAIQRGCRRRPAVHEPVVAPDGAPHRLANAPSQQTTPSRVGPYLGRKPWPT